MQALVLAAGRGKRMKPLTESVPKALLLFEGQPIIDHVLASLEGVADEVIVVTGYLAEHIENYLGNKCAFVRQPEPLGTAHALLCAKPVVRGEFILTAGDSLFPREHIRDLIRRHRRHKADATLSLKILPPEGIARSCEVTWDGLWVEDIVEKPSVWDVRGDVAASSLYILNPKVFDFARRVMPSMRSELELTDTFRLMIEDGCRVAGLMCDDWIHVTEPRDLREVSGE